MINNLHLAVGALAERFKRVAANEYHGPCPICGGHDRFRIFTDREFPHWWVACRKAPGHCGVEGWLDTVKPELKQGVSEEQIAKWRAEKEAADSAEAEKRAKKLAEFSSHELWLELNRRMNAENRAWWAKQGVGEAEQDYWKFGYNPNTQWGYAYSIPYFSPSGQPINMQYRLVNPPNTRDKYRWIGLGYSSFWTAHCDGAQREVAYIVEGAKKAAVFTARFLDNDQQVFAVPSKSDFADIAETAKKHPRRFIILDPDAGQQAVDLARKIGGALVVELPIKLDDAILAGMDKNQLRGYFRQAKKIAGDLS